MRVFLSLMAVSVAAVASPVEVQFGDVTKFSDFRQNILESPKARLAMADMLRKHLEQEAPAKIPAGSSLSVTITDVDMAGEFRPAPQRAQDLRIVKDMYPPRIELAFVLKDADGKTLKEGQRSLRDSMFLTKAFGSQQLLSFEMNLLDDWLEHEFVKKR